MNEIYYSTHEIGQDRVDLMVYEKVDGEYKLWFELDYQKKENLEETILQFLHATGYSDVDFEINKL